MKKAPQGCAARDGDRSLRACVAPSFRICVLGRVAFGSKVPEFPIRAFREPNP